MEYFKLNGIDFSPYVNRLSVTTKHKYTARENASGDLLVKYIKAKKSVQVGIIPLDTSKLEALMAAINSFDVTIEYLDPQTNTLENIKCIIPTHSVEYYTIQAGNVQTKAFTFTCEQK